MGSRESDSDRVRVALNAGLWLFQLLAPSLYTAFRGGSSVSTIYALGSPLSTVLEPPGWCFSVWAVLYFGTGAYVIWHARNGDAALARATGWQAVATWCFLAGWGVLAVALPDGSDSAAMQLLLACVLFGSLATAAALLLRVTHWSAAFTLPELLCVVAPFSALTAWLGVAFLLNAASAALLAGASWLSYTTAASAGGTACVALLGIVAVGAVVICDGNPYMAAVLVWALGGVAAANARPEHRAAEAAAASGAVATALVAAASLALFPSSRERWGGVLVGGGGGWSDGEGKLEEEPLRLARSISARRYGSMSGAAINEAATAVQAAQAATAPVRPSRAATAPVNVGATISPAV